MNQTLEDIIKQANLNGLPKETQLKIAVNYMECDWRIDNGFMSRST